MHLISACSAACKVTTIPVGAGLPAIAVYQKQMCQLTHCYRRQASSHI